MPQVTLLLFALHLQVGESGEQHRVPIHEPLAAVDQALLVQTYEYLDDRARQVRVHREAVARPVDGVSQAAHLRGDGAARLRLPLPNALHEGLASEVAALAALRLELALHDHLGCNPGMIGTGLP